jgi:hypothetical protein
MWLASRSQAWAPIWMASPGLPRGGVQDKVEVASWDCPAGHYPLHRLAGDTRD